MTKVTSVDRARAYLDKIPGAISGADGSGRTFSVCCALVRFGLSEPEAWPLLCEFNERCSPRWSAEELKHKLSDAFRKARPDARFTDSQPPDRSFEAEDKRSQWPPFEGPSKAELHQIGELRNIGDAGLALAVKRGLLRCANYYGNRCWIVTDAAGFVAQARRLDGKPFSKSDGTEAKALTLPGSSASLPVGLSEIESFPNVMLCEGGPDLLAAHHFIAVEERDFNCCAVAMLGATQRISESTAAHFAGKRVRIFAHLDATGRKSAGQWGKALLPVASGVDVFDFSGLRRADDAPVKDLNDCTSIHPDDFENNRELWNLCPA